MSSFTSRIHALKNNLTPNEEQVVHYLHTNPDKASNESIQDVAKHCGVSTASASRLAATLGYRDWKELRLALAKESGPADNPVLSDISSRDDDDTVIRKVFTSNIASLHDTMGQVATESVSRVVAAIKKTDRVVFFGSGGSGCIARDESLRFAHLDLSAEAYSEDFQMMLQAARMRRGQVAFGFSNSGRSRVVVSVMEEARRRGALTVGIANFRNTPLEDAADVFFCTAFPRRGAMTAALTARIATQSIMDAIYVLSVQHGRISREVAHMDRVLEDQLRIAVSSRAGRGGKKHKKTV